MPLWLYRREMPMVSKTRSARIVKTRLPSWIGGNDIIGASRDAGIHPTPIDASTLLWGLETIENYESRIPELVTHTILKSTGLPDAWNYLSTISEENPQSSLSAQDVAEEVQRIQRLPAFGITSTLDGIRTALSLIELPLLESTAIQAYETLLSIPNEVGSPLLPEISVSHISFSPIVVRRSSWARMLLRVSNEPSMLTTRPAQTPNELLFGSGIHLAEDLWITRDAYLMPLFLSVSPWVWCISCPRSSGVVVFDFGRPILGRGADASELLQTFLPTGPPRSGPAPSLSRSSTLSTLSWWTRQIDLVLGEITDFANFADANGMYEPRRQVEYLLSIEQLGRRIQGSFAHDRDISTQRALSFEALDTLEGLGIVTFQQACTLSHAESTLCQLEADLPNDVAELLLPRARDAVEALRDVPNGFFGTAHLKSGGMELPSNAGNFSVRPMEEAAAFYLRVLRNGHHAFTPSPIHETERRQILLSSHTGGVDRALSFLPYLYWLDVVANPHRLRRN
jgi:hypothetical protein